jgi:hypothetical protein
VAQFSVEAGRKIRVLNMLRSEDVAMPLTSLQFDRLHAERIVNRIASRKMY